jgi:hypothetical protein
LGLSGALAVRTAAPTLAFDLRGDAGLRWRALSIDGELRFAPPAGVDASGGTQAAVSQISGGIVPCGHLRAFFLCGVAQVTAVMVTGIHDPGDSATVFTGATGPRVGKDVPLWGRFALRVSADLLATLHPVAIHLDDSDAQWVAPGLTVMLGTGFVTDFKLEREEVRPPPRSAALESLSIRR